MNVQQVGEQVWGWLWPLIQSSAEEAIGLACLLGLAWLRARLQTSAALRATANAEADSIARQLDGMAALPGPAKKAIALEELARRLPLFATPLTQKGRDKLIEKAYPAGKEAARKTASIPPKRS